MKKNERISKATAIVIILGIGLMYNLNFREPQVNHLNSGVDINTQNYDSIQVSETKLMDYTKALIKNSLIHFISNL